MFIIEDWAGNRLYQNRRFESFEAAWDYVYLHFEPENEDEAKYDDIYVLPENE